MLPTEGPRPNKSRVAVVARYGSPTSRFIRQKNISFHKYGILYNYYNKIYGMGMPK